MTTRLTAGVIPGAGERVWSRAPEAPGRAVAVGPADADERRVSAALERLEQLVEQGGVVAADAGVELGAGFRSARIEGGAGNRRDGVLAALRAVGAAPLGAPAAVSVALFGIEATKPLGAAATAAVADGRWAALRFAVAAAEVLGPEQLVALLDALSADGVDPFPDGLPSVVGEQLRQVLEAVPQPRRAVLLRSLWDEVCAHQEAERRRDRRRATQARTDRLDDLRRRFARYDDDAIVEAVRRTVRREPTLADAARWKMPQWYRHRRTTVTLHDCLGATVLVRLAVSVADHGAAAALERHRHEIAAAGALLDQPAAQLAARPVPGLTGLPARPGAILRDLDRRRPRPDSLPNVIANARAYGRLALENAAILLYELTEVDDEHVHKIAARWAAGSMSDWRDKVGLFSPERLAQWWQPRLLQGIDGVSLGQLLARGEPARETIGDLLWLAELGDALAQLDGEAAATVEYGRVPDIILERPEASPLEPRRDSIALVAGGTAQLAGLAGLRPGTPVAAAARRARTWSGLIAALRAEAAVAEALTGSFAVPAAVLAADGATLPGGDEQIEVAHTPRRTAEWGAYMGNCIGGQLYTEAALAGRAFLLAVRAADGRLLLNADLRPSARGWRIDELQARFNHDPEPELADRFRAWVATLPPPPDPAHPTAVDPELPAPGHVQVHVRGRHAQEEARGGYAHEEARARYAHEEARARYAHEEARARYAHEQARGRYAQEEVRRLHVQEPTRGRHAQDPARGRRSRTPAARIAAEHGPALGARATDALRTPPMQEALQLLARLDGQADEDLAAMTALRRVSAGALTRTVAAALEAGVLTAGQVWRAGGARPLSSALAAYGAKQDGHGTTHTGHGTALDGPGAMQAAHGRTLDGLETAQAGHGAAHAGHGATLDELETAQAGHGAALDGLGTALDGLGTAPAGHGTAEPAGHGTAEPAGHGTPRAGHRVAELAPLALDEPLTGSLRTVAKAPGIAEARTTELVARRVRRAMGVLLRAGNPALAGRRPEGLDAPMLCACALAVTSWSGPGVPVAGARRVTVPGFPASALNDDGGPWVAAWPDAVELGADREVFWECVAEHGLLVPAAWLEPAGWAALWAHANRHR
ncbi:hypothetical protein ACPPVO_10675 [Dactylosporangium sp. McL0621]|uniref:hypothetical protein n=1 Tax=Dactylosporangium sp. McL0621 TaxID=3415678 RepID=UPI003CF02767